MFEIIIIVIQAKLDSNLSTSCQMLGISRSIRAIDGFRQQLNWQILQK